jgi:hypothetical protein
MRGHNRRQRQLREALLEADLWLPSEQLAGATGVDDRRRNVPGAGRSVLDSGRQHSAHQVGELFDRDRFRCDGVQRLAVHRRLGRERECAGDVSGVRELAALLARALDNDRLTLARFSDKQREHRIRAHARAERGAEAQRKHRYAFQMVVRQKQSLAGVFGDVVGMIGVARMVFVDRLVLRLAIDFPGRGVHDFADPLAQRRLGDIGRARDIEQGSGVRLPRRKVDVANACQVTDGVGAGQRHFDRSQPREIARDVATAAQPGQVRREWREIEDVDGVSAP